MEGWTARHIDEGPVGGEIDPAVLDARLDAEISDALRARQHDDGCWIFDLEADATIPAEYILLNHFLGNWKRSSLPIFAEFSPTVMMAGRFSMTEISTSPTLAVVTKSCPITP